MRWRKHLTPRRGSRPAGSKESRCPISAGPSQVLENRSRPLFLDRLASAARGAVPIDLPQHSLDRAIDRRGPAAACLDKLDARPGLALTAPDHIDVADDARPLKGHAAHIQFHFDL